MRSIAESWRYDFTSAIFGKHFSPGESSYVSPMNGLSQTIWGIDQPPSGPLVNYNVPAGPGQHITVAGPNDGITYGDNPGFVPTIQGDSDDFINAMNMNVKFETDLVWTPAAGTGDQGIPIVIAKQTWAINASANNMISAEHPSWDNSYGVKANWIGVVENLLHAPYDSSQKPELLQEYRYNIQQAAYNTTWKYGKGKYIGGV